MAASVEAELADLKRLRALVPELKAKVSAAQQKNEVLSRDLGAAQDKLAKLASVEAESAALKNTLASRDLELGNLKNDLAAVSAKVDKAEATLAAAAQIRAILNRLT